ncbi:MAG: hypothetical protein ACKPGX_21590, partial [Dolichospermum sp.]
VEIEMISSRFSTAPKSDTFGKLPLTHSHIPKQHSHSHIPKTDRPSHLPKQRSHFHQNRTIH